MRMSYIILVLIISLAISLGDSPESPALAFHLTKGQIKVLKERARDGDPKAAFKLYQHYDFVALDRKQAVVWLNVAAERDDPIAQYYLARILIDDDRWRDLKRAKILLRRASALGLKQATKALQEIENSMRD